MSNNNPDPRTLAEEALARAEAATAGPWFVETGSDGRVRKTLTKSGLTVYTIEDGRSSGLGPLKIVGETREAEFVAHARTDVPALARAVLGLLAEDAKAARRRREILDWNNAVRRLEEVEAEVKCLTGQLNVAERAICDALSDLNGDEDVFDRAEEAMLGLQKYANTFMVVDPPEVVLRSEFEVLTAECDALKEQAESLSADRKQAWGDVADLTAENAHLRTGLAAYRALARVTGRSVLWGDEQALRDVVAWEAEETARRLPTREEASE